MKKFLLASLTMLLLVYGCVSKTDIVDNMINNVEVLEVSVISDDKLPPLELSIYDDLVAQTELDNNSEYYEEFKEFNVPMTMTPRVTAYIKYFTERVPDTTQYWLDRSNKYMHIVRDIFIKEGIPTDIVVLAFTESGFNTHAISRAGAGGMWQFMPRTGRMFGMKETFWIDERRDFEKATYAAAKYLKELYGQFGDWYLALAAYNAGPGKVARATRVNKSKDFFKISKNRYTLRLETRDYVPKFLAQLIIYKNYLKYGFNPPAHNPLLFDYVVVNNQVNTFWLAKNIGVDHNEVRELNPELKLPMTPPADEYTLRVPYGKKEAAMELISKSTKNEMAQYIIYHATKNERLSTIAKRNGLTLEDLQNLNGLKYDKLMAARSIFIPIAELSDSEIHKEFAIELASLAPKYYKVKRGDTFIAIAHKHNMRANDLLKLNSGINTSRIFPGQLIVVSEGGKK